jgi:hypothetical protein
VEIAITQIMVDRVERRLAKRFAGKAVKGLGPKT